MGNVWLTYILGGELKWKKLKKPYGMIIMQ